MKYATLIAVFSLAIPAFSRPAVEPLLPAPMSRRTVELWEKWQGDNACNIVETVLGCKDQNQDCDEYCVCQPWAGCGLSAAYWCKAKHGFLDDECDCHEPSAAPQPDPESPHARRSATLSCATGQSACLIDPGFSTKSECLDLLNTLDSCGGCTSEGQGTDCTQIPGVEDVSCEYGSCKVYSCERGLKVENGTSCVLDPSYPGVKDFLASAERVWSY